MSRAIPFTKASLKRRIAAAQEAGLTVTGITPDGTLIVRHKSGAHLAVDKEPALATSTSWDDV